MHNTTNAAIASMSLLLGATAATSSPDVTALLKTRLPKTEVTGVDCTRIAGLCEVTAKENLFYVDASARYLIIGRVYDMETRQDLTAARLLELNPDMLVGGAAKANALANAGEGEASEGGRGSRSERTVSQQVAQRVDLSSLSDAGAIVWGIGIGVGAVVAGLLLVLAVLVPVYFIRKTRADDAHLTTLLGEAER